MITIQRLGLCLALVVGAIAIVPPTSAQHCEMGLRAFARSSAALLPPAPPHVSNLRGACISSTPVVDQHELAAVSDQVFVRCYCPLHAGIANISVALDGLGFRDQLFRLHRVEHPTGAAYELNEWLYFPDGAQAEGTLTLTLVQSGYGVVVRYWKSAPP